MGSFLCDDLSDPLPEKSFLLAASDGCPFAKQSSLRIPLRLAILIQVMKGQVAVSLQPFPNDQTDYLFSRHLKVFACGSECRFDVIIEGH